MVEVFISDPSKETVSMLMEGEVRASDLTKIFSSSPEAISLMKGYFKRERLSLEAIDGACAKGKMKPAHCNALFDLLEALFERRDILTFRFESRDMFSVKRKRYP